MGPRFFAALILPRRRSADKGVVAPRILNRGEDRVTETELKNLPREGGESAVAFAMGGPMNRSRGDRGSGSEELEVEE